MSKVSSAVLDTPHAAGVNSDFRGYVIIFRVHFLFSYGLAKKWSQNIEKCSHQFFEENKKSQAMGEESHNGILEGIAREHLASSSSFGNIFIGGMAWHDERSNFSLPHTRIATSEWRQRL